MSGCHSNGHRPPRHMNRNGQRQVMGQRSASHHYDLSQNIFHAVTNSMFGRRTQYNERVISSKIAANIVNFEVVDSDHPFESRVTTLDWHPRKKNVLVACSNKGDIAIYAVDEKEDVGLKTFDKFPGIGQGGCITDLAYHPTEDHLFYTSSKCGNICLKDVTGRRNQILLDSNDWEWHYSAVEAHKEDDLIIAGRSNGVAQLINSRGELIWKKLLHKQEMTSISFSPREQSLFCTSSFDGTVRLWDVRKVEDLKPLELLRHLKPVSSAYFSCTDGNRLLTTDRCDEIQVFKGPVWRMETCIYHPHRYFPHHTSFKASWHPYRDIILCSRHPDPEHPYFDQCRGIDIFDAASGCKLGRIKSALYDGRPCLNKLSYDGDKLAVVMGGIIMPRKIGSGYSLD